ncbi:phosphoribosylaminoimidazolesuccinocarboxamide synthase [Candidatus Woesearchaeota archaeon]|nr:phosphoribosylaminoimidazolesuccinocarboxamide synthase [Candidatus Woesearchaeota archaeon]
MIPDEKIRNQLENTLEKTDFNIGKKYEGKVRDNYTINGKRIIVVTDRISAFDRILTTIPFKGQVLNQTSAFWFEKTKDIVQNHVISVPDPNVMVVRECRPLPVEMVVRGYLTGVTTTSAWYTYQKGIRNFCGNILPDGMAKNQKFKEPIITPSTKAEKGLHDESISAEEILKRKLVDKKLWEKMAQASLNLFKRGTEICAKNGLILVDTKYEFGLDEKGNLTLIDEAHTPDSSRFWIMESYKKLFSEGMEPVKLDKEYVRAWLADRGFVGEGKIPKIPDDVKIEAAKRYIMAYEQITGKEFNVTDEDINERIKRNLKKACF